MSKKRGRGLLIIIAMLIAIVAGLTYLLVKEWIIPASKQNELASEIKSVPSSKVNEVVDAYNAELEAKAQEEAEAQETNSTVVPTMMNDTINNTSWVNYTDNTIISFQDGYFVWYDDDSMSSDNCSLGQFEFYVGKDAFNLLSGLFDDNGLEPTDVDSVLIMTVASKKVDGEETLESPTHLYLFGYYTDSIMSYIDLPTYTEYTFLRVSESE